MFWLLLLSQLSFSRKIVKDDSYTAHTRIDDAGQPIELQMNKFENLGDLEGANGGGILINRNKVNCILTNCKFDKCVGTNGGAIYIAYSGTAGTYNCAIHTTTFANCKSKTHGGAIYVSITQANSHSFVITNSEFNSNVAGKSGGAIYAMVRDTCTIQHCTFNGNSGSDVGSSIWCRIGWNDRYNLNELVIEDNTFTFTPSAKKSVNVYIDTYVLTGDTTPNANLQLGRCTFAKGTTTVTGYKQLEISEHNAHFESIKFTGCNCVNDDYGTVSLPYSFNPNATFAFNCQSIDTCQLAPGEPTPGPSKDGQGYDVYPQRIQVASKEYPPSLRLVKAKFTNLEYLKNDVGGGAIAIDRVNTTLTECVFEHCYTSAKSYGGGAVYVYYPGTDAYYFCGIYNSVFQNCNVSNNGGALFLQTVQPDRHRIEVEGCTFNNNIAGKFGGAIFAISRDLIKVCHSTFTDNVAINGSSLYARVGHANGKDTNDRFTFYGNTFGFTPSEGHNINVYIESIKLEANIEPRANIYLGANKFTMTGEFSSYYSLVIDPQGPIKEVNFIGCNCVQSGMNTVSIPSTVAGIAENIIVDCPGINECPAPQLPPATAECGTFSIRRDEVTNLDVRNTCFSNLNSPSHIDGGAIYITNAPLNLNSCSFYSCSSDRNGGAIYASYTGNTCNLNINGCFFDDCSAGIDGGALYFINDKSTSSSIQNTKFFNNEAVQRGGAVYYSPCAKSSLTRCFFLNNTCSKKNNQGTALYALIRNLDGTNDNVVISNNRFRSELEPNTQQFYINLKKSGKLQLGQNSFSFNKAEVTTVSSKYIYLSDDEGAGFNVNGEICVDANVSLPGLVYGFEQNVVFDCHKADEEWDNYVEVKEKELNLGLAIGIAVICGVAVIAIVIVILVIITIRERRRG